MCSISCIITSYNNAEYLSKAIMSAVKQTRMPDEIIVADDCSTDGSRELITALSNKYPVIRPIFHDRNIGVGANRDLAIRSASCELITFLDGDDWFFPEKIEAEMRSLAGQAAVAYSDVVLMRDHETEINRWDMKAFPGVDNKKRPSWISSRKQPIPTHMMMPKAVYEEAGGIHHGVNLYEDWDFKIRLSCLPYKWVYSGVAGMAYRQTGLGLSSVSAKRRLVAQLKTLRVNKGPLVRVLGWVGYMNTYVSLAVRAYQRRAEDRGRYD